MKSALPMETRKHIGNSRLVVIEDLGESWRAQDVTTGTIAAIGKDLWAELEVVG